MASESRFLGGYIGRILRVDLSKNVSHSIPIRPGFVLKYVGGRGWGAGFVWEEIPPKVDPLGPKNKLYIMTGPLTGTHALCSTKTSLSAISPATGYYGDSNVGGFFGPMLKRAGFDGIIIEGRAKKPSYIWVEDGEVQIRDASDYWGMTPLNAERAVRADNGNNFFHAISIGPAGENLVKFACITEKHGRQAGRCGMGAVMGSKNLKLIALRGAYDIPIADPEKLDQLYREAKEYVLRHPLLDLWRRQGTMQVVDWANANACLPTRNFIGAVYDRSDGICGDAMEKRIKIGDVSCFECPISCGNRCRVDGFGSNATVVGPEYETAALLGSNCGLSSIEELVQANYLCDELGIDTISAGNVAAFAMECLERGIITREVLGGIDLRFGNSEALFRFLEMVAYRKGIGDLFAEGVKTASKTIGKGSEGFAMHVKGLEISGYEHRAAPAMALSYATADIGAHHNRSWAIVYDIKTGRGRYGEDKARKVISLQHIRPLFDCLGVCRFPHVELHLGIEYYVKAYSAATGIETSRRRLLVAMERVWNLTRGINLRNGMRGGEDRLPDRVFKDAVPKGALKGTTLDQPRFRKLLQAYYRLRGWNGEGVPTREKLQALDLEDVADQLNLE